MWQGVHEPSYVLGLRKEKMYNWTGKRVLRMFGRWLEGIRQGPSRKGGRRLWVDHPHPYQGPNLLETPARHIFTQ